MKRLIVALSIILTVLFTSILCVSATTIYGVCGDNARWCLDDSGNLGIYGGGAMWDFTTSKIPSWYNKIEEHWQEYGEKLYMKNASIDDGVTSIGDYSFYNCDQLDTLVISPSVAHIGVDILNGCKSLKRVRSSGTIADWQRTVVEKPNDKLFSSIIFPNSAYIYGNGEGNSIETGTATITQSVVCSSPKSIDYLILKVRYPSYFAMSDYTAKDFQLVVKESEIVDGGYTVSTFTCQYSSNAVTPSNATLTPLEMTFQIDPSTPIGTYDIALESGTEGIDGEGNSIVFGTLAANDIKIVPKKITNIEIEGNTEVYDSARFVANITPSNTPDTSITWGVSDTDIADISSSGVLTAKRNGTVVITARATDGSGVFAEKTIRVYAYATIDTLGTDVGAWNKTFSSNVHTYQIYVNPGVTSITLTPSFTGGSLMCNDSLLINNRGKEFYLSSDMTTIELKRIGFEDFVDSTYTLVVIRHDVDSILNAVRDYQDKLFVEKDIADSALNITITPLTTTDLSVLRMYVAEYTGNTLCNIRQVYAKENDGKTTFSVMIPEQTNYKILLWDNRCCPVVEVISHQQ